MTVGSKPNSISIDLKTNMVYVSNYGSNTVSVIDGNYNNKDIFANIQDFLGRLIFGSNYNKNSIVSNTVVATIPVGNHPTSISVNPKTGMVYVANRGDDTVSVINGTKVLRTLPAGMDLVAYT